MKINIRETLDFFDGKHADNNGHVSGIIGVIGEDLNVAFFRHYKTHHEANKATCVKILNEPVNMGKTHGKKLDRWIYVKENARQEILYQTEIKNWSSHAIGGKRLPINTDHETVLKVTSNHWKRQVDVYFSNDNHPNAVTKVLVPMQPPDKYKTISIEPLLIYWMPISNTHKIHPCFSIKTADIAPAMSTPFSSLCIFSVSLYLRELLKKGKPEIKLDMPNAEWRMNALNKILCK